MVLVLISRQIIAQKEKKNGANCYLDAHERRCRVGIGEGKEGKVREEKVSPAHALNCFVKISGTQLHTLAPA